jgi:putative cell wall-binding protein
MLVLTRALAAALALTLTVPPAVADSPPSGPGQRLGGQSQAAPDWTSAVGSSLQAAPKDLAAAAPLTGPVRVVTVTEEDGHPQVEVTQVQGRAAATQAIARAQADPDVVAVEVEVPRHAAQIPTPPWNDTYRWAQWPLDRLTAEEAHARVGAVNPVLVAVLDTGVDATLPDLSPVVVPGRDFITPGGGNGYGDTAGHGTSVSAVLAAKADNNIGTAGYLQTARVMPVRVLNAEGAGTSTSSAQGIIAAADAGAKVINMSYSGGASDVEASAVAYARSKGVVLVASAGNDKLNGNPVSYPAAYDGVIGVGATTLSDTIASFSNTGTYVDLVAPGQTIYIQRPGGGIYIGQGTSYAAPHVAAVAAQLLAAKPHLAADTVITALTATAEDLGAPGRDDVYGHGMVVPLGALCLVGVCATAPQVPRSVAATPGNAQLTVTWTAPASDGGTPVRGYTVTTTPGGNTLEVGPNVRSATVTGLANGTSYTVAVRAVNSVGSSPTGSAQATPRTVPGKPASATASPGNAQATVSWTAPASDGGSPVTGYTVTANPGGKTVAASASARTATITGLTNGAAYTFTVTATNAAGTGPGVTTNQVTPQAPATAPSVPLNVTASAGAGHATAIWAAPASDGGTPVTGYTVTASPGGKSLTVGGSARSATITGLTNGTTYTLSVVAKNAVGTSPSGVSNPVTPRSVVTVPDAPRSVTASPGNAQATVSWTAPASDGGTPVTGYTVTASPGGKSVTVGGSARSATITGLTNGASYTFAVKAVNAAGSSPAATSTPVTPRTVPSAPTTVAGAPGNARATVTWSAPASNGGAAITGYRVTANPGGKVVQADAASRSAVVTGLTNGTKYTFTVAAVNAAGTGATASTGPVTPRTVPGAPTSLAFTPGDGKVTISWAVPSSDGGSPITGYTVTTTPGGSTVTAAASARSVTVTGLSNGTSYTFAVKAVNAAGSSAAATGTAKPVAAAVTVDRWAGGDRYATAALISKESFASGVPIAYVAVGTNYPDALAGAAVAGHKGGPVLLTREGGLAGPTAVELTRLKPKKIVVIGGTISETVLTELRKYATANTSDEVTRVAGKDRYATAAALSATFSPGAPVAYIASGLDFPDALAGAALAGHTGGPVLLSRPGSLPGPVAAELARLKPKKIVVIGGEVSVSTAVLNQLRGYATATTADKVTRVSGSDRYATAAALTDGWSGDRGTVYVASGANFPDALAGAAAAGAAGRPVLLTRPTSLAGPTKAALGKLQPGRIVVLGGDSAVSTATAQELARYR